MTLHVHSIMRDEARILPYWLRHYERYASAIFVWEGGSTDGTREMLDAHPLVTVFDQAREGLDDLYFTECFMRYVELSRGQADWCVAVAADEFVYHADLANQLEHLTEIHARKVRLEGYTMYADHFPITSAQIYDEVQHGYPDIWSCKTVLFDPRVDMHWKPGLHVEVSGDKHTRADIKLLHYRYLGADYYLERTRRNYRMWQLAGIDVEFDANRRHNLPDGTRGNPYEWYEANKPKLTKVV
jgi:hypothetical protein